MSRLQLRTIVQAVAADTGVPVIDLRSRRVGNKISAARHLMFYAARNLTPLSFPLIGHLLGGFDHSSVLRGCRVAEKRNSAADLAAFLERVVAHASLVEGTMPAGGVRSAALYRRFHFPVSYQGHLGGRECAQ